MIGQNAAAQASEALLHVWFFIQAGGLQGDASIFSSCPWDLSHARRELKVGPETSLHTVLTMYCAAQIIGRSCCLSRSTELSKFVSSTSDFQKAAVAETHPNTRIQRRLLPAIQCNNLNCDASIKKRLQLWSSTASYQRPLRQVHPRHSHRRSNC